MFSFLICCLLTVQELRGKNEKITKNPRLQEPRIKNIISKT